MYTLTSKHNARMRFEIARRVIYLKRHETHRHIGHICWGPKAIYKFHNIIYTINIYLYCNGFLCNILYIAKHITLYSIAYIFFVFNLVELWFAFAQCQIPINSHSSSAMWCAQMENIYIFILHNVRRCVFVYSCRL